MATGTRDSVVGKGVGAYGATSRFPPAKEVDDFHTNADTDQRSESMHHTLGPSPTQASPGNHSHDGGTSSPLWEAQTISGSRGGNVALSSVIALLVQKGAIDATTA